MRNRAACVMIENNKVALIKRIRDGRTYYVFPGGGIENGETPEQAAIREALEELGVYVQLSKTLKSLEYNGTQFYFLAKIIGGIFGTGTGEDFRSENSTRGTYEPVWIGLKQLPKLDVRPVEIVNELRDMYEEDNYSSLDNGMGTGLSTGKTTIARDF